MKRVVLTVAMMLIGSIGLAGESVWKELEAFHMVMAETFHPAEEGNLQPLRDNADDLLAKAQAWRASTVPPGYDQEKTSQSLKALVGKCEQVVSAVKAKKSDAELTTLITDAHDAFHAIMGECKSKEAEKH